jgi:hypothetical protein
MAPQGGMAAIVARRYRHKLAFVGFVARCGRVCQRQTPGEAFYPATYPLRRLTTFPVHAFMKAGKTGQAAPSKLRTASGETVHTFGTGETFRVGGTAKKTGTDVYGSNKTSAAKPT